MKEIKITQGKVTVVSDEDFEMLSKCKWHAVFTKGHWYVKSVVDGQQVYLHRFLMKPKSSKILVDHINGNGLDNRRENLRFATKQENLRNRGIQKNTTSGFRGVSLHKQTGKFTAQYKISGKKYHIGIYKTAKEASEAYETKELFGKFYKEL